MAVDSYDEIGFLQAAGARKAQMAKGVADAATKILADVRQAQAWIVQNQAQYDAAFTDAAKAEMVADLVEAEARADELFSSPLCNVNKEDVDSAI